MLKAVNLLEDLENMFVRARVDECMIKQPAIINVSKTYRSANHPKRPIV